MKKRLIPLLVVLGALILFGAAGAGAINGLSPEYVSGETITIIITNSDESSVAASLEANTFDPNSENLNFKRVYGATSQTKNDKTTWTFKIDTTGVPLGTYNLILYGDSKILATDVVEIVDKKTAVVVPEVQPEPITDPTVPKTTEPVAATSPGFGLIALLGLLAVFVKRR